MHLALCSAALPPGEHARWLPRLAEAGVHGLVVDPVASWGANWYGPRAADVAACARALRQAGLEMPALCVDLTSQPGLGWLGDERARLLSLAWLAHLSAVCRDLGGRSLVIGAGRWRDGRPPRRTWQRSRDFLQQLLTRTEAHGTTLCLRPLERSEGDFCTSATDCRILADAVEHPAIGLALSARALVDSGEMGRHAVFASHYGRLELFIADEPGSAPFGSTGTVDHAALRRHLSAGGYRDWVCLAQSPQPAEQLAASLERFCACYLRRDNLSFVRHQAGRAALTGSG